MTSYTESSNVAGASRNLAEGPTRRFRGIRAGGKQSVGIADRHGHVKLFERKRKTFTLGFYVRFLSRPASEESSVPFLGVDGRELSRFVKREISASNSVYVEILTDPLHIDAKLPPSTKGKQRNSAGMGYVEGDTAVGVRRTQAGLFLRGMLENEFLRIRDQISG